MRNVPFQYNVCVAVCSVHVHGMCVILFSFSFFLNAYSTVDIYVLLAAVRRNCISVNCRGSFETEKKRKKSWSKWEVFKKMLNEDISGHLPLKIAIIPAVMVTLFIFFMELIVRDSVWNVTPVLIKGSKRRCADFRFNNYTKYYVVCSITGM